MSFVLVWGFFSFWGDKLSTAQLLSKNKLHSVELENTHTISMATIFFCESPSAKHIGMFIINKVLLPHYRTPKKHHQ